MPRRINEGKYCQHHISATCICEFRLSKPWLWFSPVRYRQAPFVHYYPGSFVRARTHNLSTSPTTSFDVSVNMKCEVLQLLNASK